MNERGARMQRSAAVIYDVQEAEALVARNQERGVRYSARRRLGDARGARGRNDSSARCAIGRKGASYRRYVRGANAVGRENQDAVLCEIGR